MAVVLALAVGCTVEDTSSDLMHPGNNTLPAQHFGYQPSNVGDDDCLTEVCPVNPLDVCDFTNNMGTLAIVKSLDTTQVFPRPDCAQEGALHTMAVETVAVVAGEPIEETFTLHSITGGLAIRNPGEYGLVQIRKHQDKPFLFTMIKISLEQEGTVATDGEEYTADLPTTFEQWVTKAQTTSCSGRLSEEEWRRLHQQLCSD